MEIYIALLRGINVGGNNLIPMQGLVALLESLYCQDVKTYIQSGNAVFRHESDDITALSNRIGAGIKKSYGFEPRVLVLKVAELERAIASNPFQEVESDPKTLHLFFLASAPQKPDLDMLERMKADSEEFVFKDNVSSRSGWHREISTCFASRAGAWGFCNSA